VSVQAVLTQEKYLRRVEVTVHTRGEQFLHGIAASNDWEVSINDCIEKIVQQLQKVKGKWQERKRRATSVRTMPPAPAAGAAPRRSPPGGGGRACAASPLPGQADVGGRGRAGRGGRR